MFSVPLIVRSVVVKFPVSVMVPVIVTASKFVEPGLRFPVPSASRLFVPDVFIVPMVRLELAAFLSRC